MKSVLDAEKLDIAFRSDGGGDEEMILLRSRYEPFLPPEGALEVRLCFLFSFFALTHKQPDSQSSILRNETVDLYTAEFHASHT